MGNKIRQFVRASNRQVAMLGKRFKKLGATIGKTVAAGATLATAALGATILKTAELGDEAAKTARRMGLSAEALQELRFAADRQGVSSGILESSFTALQKRVGELKSGTGSLFGFLKKTGDKAFIRQIKAAKGTEEAFGLMVKKMETIKNPLERAAFAAAAFSRSGVKMISFMEAGADGIAKLRMEARKYGAVISDDAAEQSEIFVDALTNLKSAMTGIGKTLATKLIPTVGRLMQRFADFWAINKEIISLGMDKFLSFLSDQFNKITPGILALWGSLKNLFGAFWDAINSLLPAFKSETDDLSNSVNSLTGVLKIMADIGTKAFEFIKIISPFLKPFIATLLIYKGVLIALAIATKGWAIAQGLLNIALNLNPIGLFIAAIASLIGIVGVIIAKWEPIKEFFLGLWDSITVGFKAAMDVVTGIITSIDTFLEKKVGGIIDTISGIASKFGIDLGIGGNSQEPQAGEAQVISPQERISTSIEQKLTESKSTLTIKDETGRAELDQGKSNGGVNVQLATSGAF